MANTSFSDVTNIAKKWLDFLSPVLLLLVIIWLCWNLSRIIWLFLAPVVAPNLPEVARQTQAVQTNNPNNFMIFAEPTETEPVEQAIAPSNIEVKGVMVAEPMENSSALLSVNGQVGNYRLSEQIDGTDYTLSYIDWDKVILTDSSNNEITIKMQEPFQLNQKFNANSQSGDNQAMIMDMNAPQEQSFDSSSEFPMGEMGNEGQIENNYQEENDYNEDGNNGEPMEHLPPRPIDQGISELRENPSAYLSQMGMLATQGGYEVTEAMPDRLRNNSGLQLGDKIVSINGESVGSSPIADAEAFAKARESGQAKIAIKRGDAVITLDKTF